MIKRILVISSCLLLVLLGVSAFQPAPKVTGVTAAISDRGVQIKFYPNPIITTLNVDVQLDSKPAAGAYVEVKVVNMLGAETEVFKGQLDAANKHFELELKDIPAGLYFVEIETVNGSHSSKITRRITKT